MFYTFCSQQILLFKLMNIEIVILSNFKDFELWNKKKYLAERSFDLRTSGLWAQHASTAPLCSPWKYTRNKKVLSEVGFEPTPTEVDCDLNAAP